MSASPLTSTTGSSRTRASGERSAGRSGAGGRVWRSRYCYLMLLPGSVLITLFSVYPLVMSWYYSGFDWDGFSASKYFVWLGNYAELIHDPFFWRAFGRTVLFAVVATPVEIVISLLFAVLLNDAALRLRSVYRTLIFIPVVTTTAVVGIVMSFVFSAYGGPANQILQTLGLIDRPIDFLGNPSTVLWTAIGIFVWKWCGQPMIYWLAGLQTIPKELYEAAQLDGASGWRQLIHITAPMLKPFALVIIAIVTAGNLQVFAFLQALTNGGPYYSSEVMELYIYRLAFGAAGSTSVQRLGYASAGGVLFGLLLMVFGIFQVLVVRRMRRQPVREAEAT